MTKRGGAEMKSITMLVLTAAVFLASPLVLVAQDDAKVAEIVDKANKAMYYQGDDGRSKVSMIITDSQGRTREREFVILRRDAADGGDQMYYVFFNKPADVRKMAFLVLKRPGKDDDRWLYLPALDLVKRIAASDKRSSFAGSDFFYEDVSGRGTDQDRHVLAGEDENFFILDNTPVDPQAVEFASFRMWIDKKTYLPMKAEYLDKSGKKYRLIEALEVADVQGRQTITKMKVTNEESGGNTVIAFSDIQYDIGLGDDIFTERYLRKPPKEVK
jgi:outer membrane lipoprotein-sorting protein